VNLWIFFARELHITKARILFGIVSKATLCTGIIHNSRWSNTTPD